MLYEQLFKQLCDCVNTTPIQNLGIAQLRIVRRGNLERALLRLEQTLFEKLCGILYEGKFLQLLTLSCRDLGSSSLVIFKAVLMIGSL